MPVQNENDRITMLITILERGKGKNLVHFLNQNKISCHLEFSGVGTATNEMRDVLGLSNNEKDIIISLGTKKTVNNLVSQKDTALWEIGRTRGLMMQLQLSAVNNLMSAILIRNAEGITEMENEKKMKNEFDYNLLLFAVKQGYTDKVMQTARKAGATGGTVVRSRLVGAEQYEEEFGVRLDPEKEIIAILAPESLKNDILDAVNAEYGMRSPAQTILCSLPVERAFKI